MGVEVHVWRARIGAYASARGKKAITAGVCESENTVCVSVHFEFGLIVAILLIIAGVEINPGPFTMEELQQIVDAMQPTLAEANRQQTEILQRELVDVKSMVNDYKENCSAQYKEMKTEIHNLQKSNRELQEKINMHETIFRKNNILIHGIAEGENEDTIQVVSDICSDLNVQVNHGIITEAIRLGRNKGKRPILCKLSSFAKKKEIMDNNRARGNHQLAIYHDLSKHDRDFKKLLKPFRDYALRLQNKAHVRGDKLIINGESWTLDELREKFGDQVNTERQENVSHENTPSQPTLSRLPGSHKDVDGHTPVAAQQTPGIKARQVVTRNKAAQRATERDDWPLPGPSSDTTQMEFENERTSKRSYSNAVLSPPASRKASVELVKNITKKFDEIAGKVVDKSPPKKGKLANTV
jgi:uncharacterized membrane-anchored protein YhcB (DUF1043 family)